MIYKFKQINWHEAQTYKCTIKTKHYHDLCNMPHCHFESKEHCKCKRNVVLAYVFKEQVHYIICEDGKKYTWVPYSTNDGSIFLHEETKTYLSASVVHNIGPITPILLSNSAINYPDYSKVDVGIGKKWPSKVFAPFIDATAWPPLKFADLYPTTKAPYYNLGFIVSQSPTVCYPSWGTYYPAESGPLNDQIKAIRALGGDVTVSFGGAANTPLHVSAPDVQSLKEQYKRFVLAYGLTRIDFDLEGAWISPSYKAANIRNSQALKLLQSELATMGKSIDVWFTLPILTTGLTPDGLRVLQEALDAGVVISGVNAMTMDYGDWAAPNPKGKMGQYGIDAITALKDQLNTLYKGSKTEAELWAMVGTTPMIGINDVEDEVFTQTDANQTLNFAKQKNIGMISMWSMNRDKSSESRIPQTDYEFTKIFNGYNV